MFLITWSSVLADEQVELNFGKDPNGKKFVSYSVSAEALRKQPNWDPVTQEIPLSVHDAVKIATAWLNKQPRATKDQKLSSISLSCRSGDSFKDKWVYMVFFTTGYDTDRWWEIPSTAIVLLDGSVVEPKYSIADEKR